MKPKILFVLCNDYGELLVADYFLANQDIESLVLCPEKIFTTYDTPKSDCVAISGLEDISDQIQRFSPDLVIFASAYLLDLHGIANLQELKQLITGLLAKGVAVATTDPWMRCWETLLASPHIDRNKLHPFQQKQIELDRFLKPFPHIYAIPFQSTSVHAFGFFNKDAFKAIHKKEDHKVDQWLFTISKMDFERQLHKFGQHFLGHLANRFSEILVNPQAAISFLIPPDRETLLRRQLPNSARIALIPYCTFSEFQKISFNCDMGVYWNSLSASILYHLHTQSAMLFVDHGHMVEACPPLLDYVNKYSLNNVKATHCDFSKPITQDIIDNTLRIRNEMNEIIYPSYAAMSSPIELLEQLVNFSY